MNRELTTDLMPYPATCVFRLSPNQINEDSYSDDPEINIRNVTVQCVDNYSDGEYAVMSNIKYDKSESRTLYASIDDLYYKNIRNTAKVQEDLLVFECNWGKRTKQDDRTVEYLSIRKETVNEFGSIDYRDRKFIEFEKIVRIYNDEKKVVWRISCTIYFEHTDRKYSDGQVFRLFLNDIDFGVIEDKNNKIYNKTSESLQFDILVNDLFGLSPDIIANVLETINMKLYVTSDNLQPVNALFLYVSTYNRSDSVCSKFIFNNKEVDCGEYVPNRFNYRGHYAGIINEEITTDLEIHIKRSKYDRYYNKLFLTFNRTLEKSKYYTLIIYIKPYQREVADAYSIEKFLITKEQLNVLRHTFCRHGVFLSQSSSYLTAESIENKLLSYPDTVVK